MPVPSQNILDQFIDIVGRHHALTSSDDLTRYTHENRDIIVGKTPLVLKPGNTGEVSHILKLANETQTAIVPQGGHTGHSGGAVPNENGEQIVLSLERMNRIEEIDLDGNVIICEAGTVLETLQNTAAEHNRLFPLSLGSQGSCQIGGNISTNAGGTGVIAYGNTRALVLGLEVVLPSGEIWNGLRRLKKDNTGYDLKDLFIGAEGTLGVVTRCVVKLFPATRGKAVAFCGLETPNHALRLLELSQNLAGHSVTTFELMGATPFSFTMKHMQGVRDPLEDTHAWYVMLELSSGQDQLEVEQLLEKICSQAFENGIIADAALSNSQSQIADFWRIREQMPPSQKCEGGSIKHDISVPIHKIPEFLERADALVRSALETARPCAFGHAGDGNMHYNVTQPEGMDSSEFFKHQNKIQELVFGLTVSLGGSISAEHGIGRFKKDLLAKVKDPLEMAMMRKIKQSFDPNNIMNPGKIL